MNKWPMPWDKREGKLSTRNIVIGTGVLGLAAAGMGAILVGQLLHRRAIVPNLITDEDWQAPMPLNLPDKYATIGAGKRDPTADYLALCTPYSTFSSLLQTYRDAGPTVAFALKRGEEPWGVIDSNVDLQACEPFPDEDPRLVLGVGVDGRPASAAIGIITPDQIFEGVTTELVHSRRLVMSMGALAHKFADVPIILPPSEPPQGNAY